jgi:hypothetical protein
MNPCSEPDGNELVDDVPAHVLMLRETGQCPWCGETELKYNTRMDPISPDFDIRSW